jgi:thymidylate synthase ThyX
MAAREIYLLSPRSLSPETIAVAFAKTSRSPESFHAIAAELSDEKSAQFHEKWVVGYGHASVAEHAVLHLAFENVSRLSIECIESNRLASYTEKSTRYQKWLPEDFTVPPELEGHALRPAFIETCRALFQTYADSLVPVRTLIEKQSPRRENESEEAWDRRVRSQYVDTCRFILPAAANANVGMTANARALENMIRKMLSHELGEVREIGEVVKRVASAEAPTLVKYADASAYLMETIRDPALHSLAVRHTQGAGSAADASMSPAEGWCRLVDYDQDGECKILAAALYRFAGLPFAEALRHVQGLKEPEKATIAEALLRRLGEHDTPLRELEYATCTFDLVMDQGAYAEFKRHRMMSQTPQALTTRLGYAMPRLLSEAGFEASYESAMQMAAEMYERLREMSPLVAQYVVPNGFNRRVLAQFNLREAFHFCQLRAAKNAHFSIRRVAKRIHAELRRVYPLLTDFMHIHDESWQQVEQNHFSSV